MAPLFRRKNELRFERIYPAPAKAVWRAWTEPDRLRTWWGPPRTEVAECEIDLRVGGRIHVVTQGGERTGRYAGTRWPMDGTFTCVDDRRRLTYDARSWTEGEEDGTTISHTNDVTLTADGDRTVVTLEVSITEVGPAAKVAVFGMKWGYKAQLNALEKHLAR